MADQAYVLEDHAPKKALSRNLLKMKFMQRRLESDVRKQLEEDRKKEIDASHWVIDHQLSKVQSETVEVQPSFVVCEELLPNGRMSFKNFNPTVEKLYKDVLRDYYLDRSEVKEKQEGISDEEMTQRYQSLIGTISKKFINKRKRSSANISKDDEISERGFLKPKD